MIRLEVAVAAPLQQTLTYLFPDDLEDDSGTIPVGKRVLIPLGNRRVTGYVLGQLPEEDVGYKLRSVIEVLDLEPLFPVNLIPFFRWVARYYHYPLGEVIKTALPSGLAPRSGKQLFLTEMGRRELARISEENGMQELNWLPRLMGNGSLSAAASMKILGQQRSRKLIHSWQQQNLIEIREILIGNDTRQKNEICYFLASDLSLPLCLSSDPSRDELKNLGRELTKKLVPSLHFSHIKTLYSLQLLAGGKPHGAVPAREMNKVYSGAAKALPFLLEQGLVSLVEQRVFRNPYGEQLSWFPKPGILTPEQDQALSVLIPAIQKKKFATFLLHGVTGCGKTEVYLQAAGVSLASGRDVLVLVPEIALATQLEAHFVSRFGERVLILHSGLSTGERFDQWSLASKRQPITGPQIVIGARSAVFAPLQNPGLIVVDEEHDSGFKQDDGLRYNGRDLAILRARFNDAVVLLGSATPSVTSFYHAQEGKYSLLTMNKRVQERSLPSVSLVDLRDKLQKAYGKALGKKLQQALQETLAQGKQSLLLLNRRGFSSVYLCQDCGKPVECKHCHISLTFHKGKNQLVCHYCGFSLNSNLLCAGCHSDKLVPVGFGTERIEQEVLELLPEARIARLDSDTAADRKKFLHILKAMHNREIDILIGTQMIAKGHDFPEVTLVGVVWADGGLSMPDFRAAERTYQLLSQVSGRAGRGSSPGRVIIQTLRPDHYAVALAQHHAYSEMYEREMAIRQMPAFPPLLRMINIHIQGGREREVRQAAADIAAKCRILAKSLAAESMCHPVEILGPAPSPLDRLRDRYRWQVLLKGVCQDDLHAVCHQVVTCQADFAVGDIKIGIDVDPENMM
ncbi:MAG: primosomal protein N' [Proteobacteria bacterium]|jgi:primosomal protein N' (replication factor Y)|nr:primosomal protein N' [Desulfocapsa sp.]MBU3943377.1 primosomal protein N' [Pseudomonadota bacterium]MCG2744658.1 primosomal protein N' [Desulfobacteraceae bacterium]MBU3983161.1 primosomal protein N' [Pseudomonadota bacterium]MBU4029995.1 primosomal protein N' [Pseudomonadota bacterium]